jgi:DNA-binding LacI/PurR family transcriptional regulator
MPKKKGEGVEIKKDVTTEIETTTKGLQQSYKKHLTELPSQQAIVICNYVTAVGKKDVIHDRHDQCVPARSSLVAY